MRRIVRGLGWLVVALELLGAAGETWLAVNPADPTQTSAIGAVAGTAGIAGILVALPLLFMAGSTSVRGGLPLIPPAIGAYWLAGLSTLDGYYWPQHVRYIDHLSSAGVVAIVTTALVVGILVWRLRVLGAVATVALVVGLFMVSIVIGTH